MLNIRLKQSLSFDENVLYISSDGVRGPRVPVHDPVKLHHCQGTGRKAFEPLK